MVVENLPKGIILGENEDIPEDDGYENIRNGNLGAYHTYDEILEELIDINEKYPDITRLEVIGTTHWGQDIYAIKISKYIDMDDVKPAVLYMGQTHAREVIAAEQALGVIKGLVEGYGNDGYVSNIVDNREIWVVPCVNPDGSKIVTEEVTRYDDSAWRKNARDVTPDNYHGSGLGVDLNRNFGVGWGGSGSSGVPTSEIYRGPAAFSEPETQAIKNLADKHRFVTSLSFHSFSGLILYPYGYTTQPSGDEELFKAIAYKMRDRQPHEKYIVKQASDLYFDVVGGDSDDWLYDEYGTLAFTMEIGWGYYGYGIFRMFNPPEKDIPYHVENNLDAALYLAEIADNPRKALADNPEYNTYLADAVAL